MTNLKRAHEELFRRTPTRRSPRSRPSGSTARREGAVHRPVATAPTAPDGAGRRAAQARRSATRTSRSGLNDWSFTQLCGLAGVSRDTVNRLLGPISDPAALSILW